VADPNELTPPGDRCTVASAKKGNIAHFWLQAFLFISLLAYRSDDFNGTIHNVEVTSKRIKIARKLLLTTDRKPGWLSALSESADEIIKKLQILRQSMQSSRSSSK
jgi:hypothetical protein